MAVASSLSVGSNLEIKTKSIEQTLLPFVNQISVLINHKERPVRNARVRDAFRRVGKEVQVAVDRFVMIGEQIAEDYLQIHEEMTLACREAHEAGSSIWQVTSDRFASPPASSGSPSSRPGSNDKAEAVKSRLSLLREKQAVLRAARFLLQSVTKVLLLADKVLIFQILDARDKLSHTLLAMSTASAFSDFVQLFSQYGSEMVSLAHLSGERLNDLKDDKRRAQLASARYVLEKTTSLLLTSSKLYLRHPDCNEARIVRDIVYMRMHGALLLCTYAVVDGDSDIMLAAPPLFPSPSGNMPDGQLPSSSDHRRQLTSLLSKSFSVDLSSPSAAIDAVTLHNSLRKLEDAIDMIRISDEPLSNTTPDARWASIMQAMKGIDDGILDFTDCNDVPQSSRQLLVSLADKIRTSLAVITEQSNNPDAMTTNTVSTELHKCQNLAQDMQKALQDTAIVHANATLNRLNRIRDDEAADGGQDDDDEHFLYEIRRSAMHANAPQLDNACAMFITKSDALREVTRMLKHAAQAYNLLMQADRIEQTLQALQKQIIYSAQVLLKYPASKIARENLDVFLEAWQGAVLEVGTLARECAQAGRQSRAIRMGYMSLPRRGRHGAAPRIPKPKAVELCFEDQSRLAKHGLEMKLITSEMDAETERWGVNHQYAHSGLPAVNESYTLSSLQNSSTYPQHHNTMPSTLPTYRPHHQQMPSHNSSPSASFVDYHAINSSATPTTMIGSGASGGGGSGQNVDIVSRAKSMSTLAFQMYLFTRGEGPLRTTQDLFIQAEQFAEEANRLFRVVRDFAANVPAGTVARVELAQHLESVPPHVQRLLSSLKQPTVGKPATFNKVDAVIQETKHLMNAIAKVVTTCFICATKYDIEPCASVSNDKSTNKHVRHSPSAAVAAQRQQPPLRRPMTARNNNTEVMTRTTLAHMLLDSSHTTTSIVTNTDESNMPNLAYYYSAAGYAPPNSSNNNSSSTLPHY